MNTIHEISRLIEGDSRVAGGNGATAAEIDVAQVDLRLIFPSGYIDFLATYGWIEIDNFSIFGLGRMIPKHLNVVVNTMWERKMARPSLPQYLIVIANDGAGNQYCIDSRFEPNQEPPIVFWDHEHIDGDRQVPNRVADAFLGWIYDKCRNILK